MHSGLGYLGDAATWEGGQAPHNRGCGEGYFKVFREDVRYGFY